MPQYQAPNPSPTWAEGGDALVSQPTPSQIASGFTLNQRPTPNALNWALRQLARGYQYLAQGVNATLLGTEQQFDWRLIGGGSWSWAASTGVLAWSEAFALAMPGLADSANSCAAGSVTLTAGQVAYASCNAPFSTTGTLTSGSKTISDLAFESGITVGATVTGTGLPAGVTVTDVSASDSTITLSAAATASSAKTPLVFATSGPLTVKAADTATFSPSPTTVVLARCVAVADMPNHVVVGLNAGVMLLRDGEQKRLLGQGFVTTRTVTCGVAVPARTPLYISPGATDGSRSPGRAYPVEAAAGSDVLRATFAGFASSAATAGGGTTLVSTGVLSGFSGLTLGYTYYAKGVGGLGVGPETAAGAWTCPVGVALSTTELLVTAGAPPARTAATFSYKSAVFLGNYWSTNSTGSLTPVSQVIRDFATGNVATMVGAVPLSHSGSIVSLMIHANNTINVPTAIYVYKNNTLFFVANNALPANVMDNTISYAVNQYPLAASDVLSASVIFNPGAQTPPAGNNGVNIAFNLYAGIAFNP